MQSHSFKSVVLHLLSSYFAWQLLHVTLVWVFSMHVKSVLDLYSFVLTKDVGWSPAVRVSAREPREAAEWGAAARPRTRRRCAARRGRHGPRRAGAGALRLTPRRVARGSLWTVFEIEHCGDWLLRGTRQRSPAVRRWSASKSLNRLVQPAERIAYPKQGCRRRTLKRSQWNWCGLTITINPHQCNIIRTSVTWTVILSGSDLTPARGPGIQTLITASCLPTCRLAVHSLVEHVPKSHSILKFEDTAGQISSS